MTDPMTVKKPKSGTLAALAIGTMIAVTGCASNQGAREYKASEVGQISRVEEAVIVSSEPVTIEGREGYLGAVTGAVIGGIAGSQIGGDDASKTVGGVGGAVGGGVIGREIEKAATRKPGFRYTVKLLDDGELITIVQGGDVAMANGTPVYVQYGERARVIPRDVSVGY